MDILASRDIEITNLALNGLMKRQHAIAANAANVMTPGYQRKEVSFEEQLGEIMAKDDIRQNLRTYNSTLPPDAKTQVIPNQGFIPVGEKNTALSAEQLKFLSQNDYNQFEPQLLHDFSEFDPETDFITEYENKFRSTGKSIHRIILKK